MDRSANVVRRVRSEGCGPKGAVCPPAPLRIAGGAGGAGGQITRFSVSLLATLPVHEGECRARTEQQGTEDENL